MKKFAFKYIFIYLIRFYHFTISPFIAASCRFTPTCSSFAIGVIEKYGVFLGGWFAIKRLLRCHPFGRFSGYDPLP